LLLKVPTGIDGVMSSDVSILSAVAAVAGKDKTFFSSFGFSPSILNRFFIFLACCLPLDLKKMMMYLK
jgi:hypothetical protein